MLVFHVSQVVRRGACRGGKPDTLPLREFWTSANREGVGERGRDGHVPPLDAPRLGQGPDSIGKLID